MHTRRQARAEQTAVERREVERRMDWKTLLAYITGTVDQELLLRNEYLVTENRILRSQIKGRLRLSDGERMALAEIGQKLGKQALKEVAKIVKPDTILGWHRQLVAQKFDGSQQRRSPGRPKIDPELEALIVLSLSRLNHGQPGVQAHPEIVQGTAALHHEIAPALLPQADPIFHHATTLDAAVAMLDPPPLVERLVGPLVLQGQLRTAGLLRRPEDRHLRERERQEAQSLHQPPPSREGGGGGRSDAPRMDTAAVGVAQ